MVSPRLRAFALAGVVLTTAGCVRGCTSSRPPVHLNPSMDQQPKYKAQSSSDFFYDGAAMRKPVEGTIARGELREDTAFFEGTSPGGVPIAKIPVEVTDTLKARGAERYRIYCAPCHDLRGDGKGILFQRGNVPTPSLHQVMLRAVGDGYIYGVIANGKGLMPSYRWPIPPADRWAIVAHVRELQLKREQDAAGAASAAPPAPATPGAASPEPAATTAPPAGATP
jgi:hypothetical protein